MGKGKHGAHTADMPRLAFQDQIKATVDPTDIARAGLLEDRAISSSFFLDKESRPAGEKSGGAGTCAAGNDGVLEVSFAPSSKC